MIKYNNLYKTFTHLNAKYNLKYSYNTWNNMRNNDLYSGEYRGIKEFCEPYISREQWLVLKGKTNIKKTQNNRVYLFTGLIKCPYCGCTLGSNYGTNKYGTTYKSYKCRNGRSKICDYRTTVSEIYAEKYLLDNLEQLITHEIESFEIKKVTLKKQPKTDVAKLKEKLRKLNVMYMAGTKTDEEYLQEVAELNALIGQASQKTSQVEKDITPLKELLKTDYRTLYDGMTLEDKRRFWRSIIKEIRVEGREIKEVIFLTSKFD